MLQKRINFGRKTLKSKKGSALIKMNQIKFIATANYNRNFKIESLLVKAKERDKELKLEIKAQITLKETLFLNEQQINAKLFRSYWCSQSLQSQSSPRSENVLRKFLKKTDFFLIIINSVNYYLAT
ncbi:UNKNOWN [Stylonychia lemnae]|uniref:Uncharacterized protein n=1 Tax=Stylonychia lemnae TaxID=5949 RepID=A0A078ACE6_STYLE|nr:UNKNOWN [Stylonychia lemnae]|eukprot:CDW78493.1 UNKNOWN [Stylonychia lemnae]